VTLRARPCRLTAEQAPEWLGQPTAGPGVEIAVDNTGPPIAAAQRGRLFHEPFQTTKPRHRGLGLAIVYRILQAHRGGVQWTSGPDGTTVAAVVPAA
jgi:signal transduction histidine kinase